MTTTNELAASKPYQVEAQTRSLVNSEVLSDVIFLVGPKKRKIFGHRFLLSLGSPVFFAMFNGGLKPTDNKPIKVPDLEEDGFLNMLKYIYGHKILDNLDLKTLRSTYIACEKYLVYHFTDSMLDFVKKKLCAANCCTFYQQFLKIDPDGQPMGHIERFIALNGKAVIGSDAFLEIDQATLLRLLQLKYLNAPECEVLKACFKWVDRELERRGSDLTPEHRQGLFRPIRDYLKLGDFSTQEYSKISNLDSFFSKAELGELFLCLFKEVKSSPFLCLTDRVQISSLVSVYSIKGEKSVAWRNSSELSLKLSASKLALIRTISTVELPKELRPVSITFYENGVVLKLTQDLTVRNVIILDQFFEVHPDRDYKLVFNFPPTNADREFKFSGYVTSGLESPFTVSEFGPFHLIDEIQYHTPYDKSKRV